LALARSDAITAIISQNGNAFVEGLGDFWDHIRPYWANPTQENRESIRWLISFETTKSQYTSGEKDPSAIPPETYYLDQALLDRPGNGDIQLDLFLDYRKNVDMYPVFHTYLRDHQPPVLAIWGKNDGIFIPPGAEAFKTVVKNTQVEYVDGGHFALENHLEEMSEVILKFLEKSKI
jgi:pimeloyl-ACP methyl ester carboxylesterase